MVVRIDRIGRRWLDTLQCVIALRARGVKIRSLDETEGWTQFLELEPDDPLAFVGHQMVSMAAWVADQEREVGRRRTREGLAAARARGQTLGRRALPHRPAGAAGEAHEGSRSVGAEDRAAPGGQRKDGAQRPKGGTLNIAVTAVTRTGPGATETRGEHDQQKLAAGPVQAQREADPGAARRPRQGDRTSLYLSYPPRRRRSNRRSRMSRRAVVPSERSSKDLLKFRWSIECPDCGFKVTGNGQPQPGQRLARCGRCKVEPLPGRKIAFQSHYASVQDCSCAPVQVCRCTARKKVRLRCRSSGRSQTGTTQFKLAVPPLRASPLDPP